MDGRRSNFIPVYEEEIFLEESILFHESKCEVKHKKTTCSEVVTHRCIFKGCPEPDVNVCQNASNYFDEQLALCAGGYCASCGRPVIECWTKVPV
jgi:hypothetical protein